MFPVAAQQSLIAAIKNFHYCRRNVTYMTQKNENFFTILQNKFVKEIYFIHSN